MSSYNPNRHPAGTPIGGRFAEGRLADADPSVTLDDTQAGELPTITVPVTFQRWNDNDYAVDVGSDSFDLAPLIAEVSPDERMNEVGTGPGDLDHWVELAMARGLIEKHDGPFYADSMYLEEWLEDNNLEDLPSRRAQKIIPGVPLKEPLTVAEVLAEADENGFVTATVEAHLEDLMQAYSNGQGMGEDDDHDLLAARVSPLPPNDCSYKVTGVSEDGALVVDFTTNVRAAAAGMGYDEDETSEAS